MRRLPALLAAFLLLLASPAFAQQAAQQPSGEPAPTSLSPAELAKVLPDHVLGEASAPVTITEYASLNCSHCADFYKTTLPELKKKYIDAGKVKLVFRDFPLNAIALRAAQLAHCMPEDRFFPFVKVLYGNLEGWLTSNDPETTLQQYAKLAGLSPDRVTSCLADKTLQGAIVQRRLESEKTYQVAATPTFIINASATQEGGTKLEGAQPLGEFDKALAKFVK